MFCAGLQKLNPYFTSNDTISMLKDCSGARGVNDMCSDYLSVFHGLAVSPRSYNTSSKEVVLMGVSNRGPTVVSKQCMVPVLT